MLFTFDRKERFISLQKQNEERLQQFVEFFEYACYKFSWILNYNKNPIGGNNHTHGGVVELLDKISVPRDAYLKWVLEPEHGFCHSFCVLYFAYCLHEDKSWLWDDLHWYERRIDRGRPRFTHADNLIVSCLLHDFMRYVDGDQSRHDQRISEITDLLLPETYSHSHPVEESLLVKADRLELLRYEDHHSWIDHSLIDKSVNAYGKESLSHFFSHIRPVLERMFVGRNDIWFSHALEIRKHPIWNHVDEKYLPPNLEDNLGVDYYPRIHWIPEDPGYKHHMKEEYEKYFSVHTGKLPFENCIAYTRGYYRAQAIIDKSTVKKYGCDIRCAPPSTAGRDHVFVVQNQRIPTKEWCFLYDFGTNQDNQFDQIELRDLRTLKASLFNDIYRASQMFLNHFECLCLD